MWSDSIFPRLQQLLLLRRDATVCCSRHPQLRRPRSDIASSSSRIGIGSRRFFINNLHVRTVISNITTTTNNNNARSSSSSTIAALPSEANVIVIGGGIIGASVAYHLTAKLGVQNVLLLEKHGLTSGTTWHAAGLINTFGSLSYTSTYMRQYTRELYANILPTETGLSCGYKPVGFIELACDIDRLAYYRRVAAFNRYCGVNVIEISPEEVKERCPIIECNDVLAGFYVESDGRANPTDSTMALIKGAKMAGAHVVEGVSVSGVTTTATTTRISNDVPKVTGVTFTTGETIRCNAVANCAGMWARQLGQRSCGGGGGGTGVTVPNQAAEHYYLLTEPINGIDPNYSIVEDSSKCLYVRPEGGGLMLGLFETQGASWNVDSIPEEGFVYGQIDPDWERMGPYLESAMERVPIAKTAGVKSFFCGPESFTPDGYPIVGESSEIRNYFIAAGMNSVGILTGGGVGKILAHWIKDGRPPTDVDITAMDATRFKPYQNNPMYRQDRSGETLGNTYKTHYPDKQPHSCRGGRRSPLHHRLKKRNAYFRDVSGWESPAWYAPMDGPSADIIAQRQSFGREDFFQHWSDEHTACRTNVALFDMSFMSKFAVMGNDAGRLLNQLSTANVDEDVGVITYTQWLNETGRMEADLTVTKLNDEHYLVIATDTQHNQVLTKLRRQICDGGFSNATILDVTGAYCQINLQGPKSRELLQKLTSCNLDNAAFPFRKVAEIDIGYARVLCARITYVGELGYELYIPAESAVHVYDLIVEHGMEYSLRHAGLRALGSLRHEKGYRDFGHDMDNTDTILDVGLGFTCNFDKPAGFIGMDAVIKYKNRVKAAGGLTKRLAQVLVNDPEPLLHHGEIVWRNGKRECEVRSASYGHTVGGAVGLCMLERTEGIIDKTYIDDGEWSVEIGNTFFPCTVSLRPLYDPKNERIKA